MILGSKSSNFKCLSRSCLIHPFLTSISTTKDNVYVCTCSSALFTSSKRSLEVAKCVGTRDRAECFTITKQRARYHTSCLGQRELIKWLLHCIASLPLTAARIVHARLITKHLRQEETTQNTYCLPPLTARIITGRSASLSRTRPGQGHSRASSPKDRKYTKPLTNETWLAWYLSLY